MKAVPACYPYSGEADAKEERIHGFSEWCDLLLIIYGNKKLSCLVGKGILANSSVFYCYFVFKRLLIFYTVHEFFRIDDEPYMVGFSDGPFVITGSDAEGDFFVFHTGDFCFCFDSVAGQSGGIMVH